MPTYNVKDIQYFGDLDPRKSHHAKLRENDMGLWDRHQMGEQLIPHTVTINPDQEYWRSLKYEGVRMLGIVPGMGEAKNWSRFQMIGGL